jgi:hypothetical protein
MGVERARRKEGYRCRDRRDPWARRADRLPNRVAANNRCAVSANGGRGYARQITEASYGISVGRPHTTSCRDIPMSQVWSARNATLQTEAKSAPVAFSRASAIDARATTVSSPMPGAGAPSDGTWTCASRSSRAASSQLRFPGWTFAACRSMEMCQTWCRSVSPAGGSGRFSPFPRYGIQGVADGCGAVSGLC